jgi:hypothetical protein
LERLEEFKIATIILDTSMVELANEWGVHKYTPRHVCLGKTQSKELSARIDAVIARAETIYIKHLRQKGKLPAHEERIRAC